MINFKLKNNLDKITFANHCNICNVIMRKYEIKYSYIGYESQTVKIKVNT